LKNNNKNINKREVLHKSI